MLCSICATFCLYFDGPASGNIPPCCVRSSEKYLWNVSMLIYNILTVKRHVNSLIAAAELAIAVTLLANFFMEFWNGRKCHPAL